MQDLLLCAPGTCVFFDKVAIAAGCSKHSTQNDRREKNAGRKQKKTSKGGRKYITLKTDGDTQWPICFQL